MKSSSSSSSYISSPPFIPTADTTFEEYKLESLKQKMDQAVKRRNKYYDDRVKNKFTIWDDPNFKLPCEKIIIDHDNYNINTNKVVVDDIIHGSGPHHYNLHIKKKTFETDIVQTADDDDNDDFGDFFLKSHLKREEILREAAEREILLYDDEVKSSLSPSRRKKIY